MQRRVLVTAGRAPAALEWVRALHDRGWTVFVGDSLRFTSAGFSRFADARVSLPPARYAPFRFREAILRAIDELRLDLVMPTCEEVFYLASLHAKVFCPPLDVLARLHSKWTFLEIAARCGGVQIPPSELMTDRAQLPAQPRDWVFKAEFSRFGEGTRVGCTNGVEPSVVSPWVKQRRLRGQEVSGYGVAVAGALKAWVTYRPVYRIAGASGVYFRRVIDEEARAFASRLVRELRFHGQIAFDFMRTLEGLFVLECNPRATSGVHLFEDRLAAVLDGEVVAPGGPDRMLSPALALVRPVPALGRFLSDVWNAKDAVFSWRDPLPLIGMGAHVMETCWLSLARKVSLKAAMTRDLEWDGEPFDQL